MTDTTTVVDPSDQLYSWLTSMREDDPVHLDEHGVVNVFRHEHVSRVLGETKTFSSDLRRYAPPEFIPRSPEGDMISEGNVIGMDPPEHHDLRGLIVSVFTPRVVDALIPRITEIATDLLDAADQDGSFDLVDTLSYPLPVIVIAELLGVPISDQPIFRRWAEELIAGSNVGQSLLPDENEIATRMSTLGEMRDYLLAQARTRRDNPTDDLIGRLVAAEVDGERLTDGQIVGFAAVLLLAGHVTTTATLGNAVYCLDRTPEATEALRADPRLVPACVEEVIRYRSPFPRLARVTTTEVELGGRTVPSGTIVIPWVAAANRDPRVFADPDRFDVHRSTTGHLAFGHGIHFCIGSRLARVEARVVLDLLIRRYGTVAVDPTGGVEFTNPYSMIGVSRLPVTVTR
ncbi:MAG: cytochrome P450 [Actinocatenispora sp.]